MNYKRIQETLNKLSDLLTEIQIKEQEVTTAIAYNKKWSSIGLNIDVHKLQVERNEMQLEFKRLTRTL